MIMERLQIVRDASKTVTLSDLNPIGLGPAAGVLWTRFLLRVLTLIRTVLLSFGSPVCGK